jgi:hypothetical protein
MLKKEERHTRETARRSNFHFSIFRRKAGETERGDRDKEEIVENEERKI